MKNTRKSWLPSAHRAWFQLSRHDDPDPSDPPNPPADPSADPPADPEDPSTDPPGDPDPSDPEGADQLGDAGQKALKAMKAERAAAKRAAAAEKQRADELAAKVQEFEDRDKSELERAVARAERAEAASRAATDHAVKAEVRSLASDFVDASDALVHLQEKMAGYSTADGNVDTETIRADLSELLEQKPHLRKQTGPDLEPDPKKGPRPDPSQGPRDTPTPTDYRSADRSTLKGGLAKYGVRLRG